MGEANYRYFLKTMDYIMAMEVSHFFIQLGLVIDSFLGGATAQRQDDWLDTTAVNAVLIFFMCFNAVSIFLIGQLLWFHIGLQREKLTTYQYIVREHKRRRDQARNEVEIQSKRVVAATKAQREGKPCLAFRLELGGPCRKLGCTRCDPLDIPPELLGQPDEEAGFGASLGGSAKTSADSRDLYRAEPAVSSQDESDSDGSDEVDNAASGDTNEEGELELEDSAKEDAEPEESNGSQVTFIKVKENGEADAAKEESNDTNDDADQPTDEESSPKTGSRI